MVNSTSRPDAVAPFRARACTSTEGGDRAVTRSHRSPTPSSTFHSRRQRPSPCCGSGLFGQRRRGPCCASALFARLLMQISLSPAKSSMKKSEEDGDWWRISEWTKLNCKICKILQNFHLMNNRRMDEIQLQNLQNSAKFAKSRKLITIIAVDFRWEKYKRKKFCPTPHPLKF